MSSTRPRKAVRRPKPKAKSKSKPKARKAGTRPRASKKAPSAMVVGRKFQTRRDPETLRLRSIEPSFTVGDLQKSIRFYTEVLGFIVEERWVHDGVLRGVMVKAGGCEIGLSQDDWAKGRDRKKGEGMRIWCSTAQDIDALAARIKSAGGRLTEEPKDQSWGARSLAVNDPDGFGLTIYRET